MSRLCQIYCQLISNRLFAFFVVSLLCGYWYFTITGSMRMQTRLNATKVLPNDSPIQLSNKILDEIVYREYLAVTVLVNKPFNPRDERQRKAFWEMVRAFESIEKCKGSEYSLIWLREYEQYLHSGGDDPLKSLLDFFGGASLTSHTTTPNTTNGDVDLCHLDEFLDSPLHNHWKAFVRLGHNPNSSCPTLDRFWMAIVYSNASSWDDRVDLVMTWRDIALRYRDELNATIWENNVSAIVALHVDR